MHLKTEEPEKGGVPDPDIYEEEGRGSAKGLSQTIVKAGNVVLPKKRDHDGGWQYPPQPWRIKSRAKPEFTDFGFVNLKEDEDSCVRRQHLLLRDRDGSPVPQYALALFARAREAQIDWDDVRGEIRLKSVGDEVPALDGDQTLRINFVGPPGTFHTLSFSEVLKAADQQQPLPALKKAKIVIIGYNIPSEQDAHVTPYSNNLFGGHSPSMLGMEIHANIIATLADQRYIITPGRFCSSVLLFGFSIVLGIARVCLPGKWPRLMPPFILVAWGAFALAAFVSWDWRIDVIPIALLCVLAYLPNSIIASGFVRFRRSGRDAAGSRANPMAVRDVEPRSSTGENAIAVAAPVGRHESATIIAGGRVDEPIMTAPLASQREVGSKGQVQPASAAGPVAPQLPPPEETPQHQVVTAKPSAASAVTSTRIMEEPDSGRLPVDSAEPDSEIDSPTRLFYSYSHKDETLRDQLEEALASLKRQRLISSWHDRRIEAGEEWRGAIDKNLDNARVILLLVSSSFLASDYCWDVETKRALERHERGEAIVIPFILRPCDWHGAPFGKLQALPKDAKAVTSWRNKDEAWTDVAKGIRRALEALTENPR